MTLATAVVRFTAEGLHCWPEAPDHRAYLRDKHRHLFYVEVQTVVSHDDREIEFHDLLDRAKMLFPKGDFGARSCEMLARRLGEQLAYIFGREFVVSVFEDNEVGASVTSKAA